MYSPYGPTSYPPPLPRDPSYHTGVYEGREWHIYGEHPSNQARAAATGNVFVQTDFDRQRANRAKFEQKRAARLRARQAELDARRRNRILPCFFRPSNRNNGNVQNQGQHEENYIDRGSILDGTWYTHQPRNNPSLTLQSSNPGLYHHPNNDIEMVSFSQGANLENDSSSTRPREDGVYLIEEAAAIWDITGDRLIILGIILVMIMFIIDNATVHIYHKQAAAEFSALSKLTGFTIASSIIFGVSKLFVAKLSNALGRGKTLLGSVLFFVISAILMAAAPNMKVYGAGMIMYAIAQSSIAVLIGIIISDLTTPRWRALALSGSYFPYLITPWVAEFMVDSVVKGGMGWRWGIGIYGFLMPVAASLLIGTLLFYEQRAKEVYRIFTDPISLEKLAGEMDFGGLFLFMLGSAALLLPMALAANQTNSVTMAWIFALIFAGIILLSCVPYYERYAAANPFLPGKYFKNQTILFSFIIICLDTIGFSCTHTYLNTWAMISESLPARTATYYTYTNAVMQCLAGIFAGVIMLWRGKYKWLVFVGATIRFIGYGLMVRLSFGKHGMAEIFIQQLLQGFGSGIIHAALMVPAQTQVNHSQIAQVLALVHSFSFLGSSIGSCIAGAIYTKTFREKLWLTLGNMASDDLVNKLYESIPQRVPVRGTIERLAVNAAYSDVMRNMIYVAIATSIPLWILSFFLPNLKLPSENNSGRADSETDEGVNAPAQQR